MDIRENINVDKELIQDTKNQINEFLKIDDYQSIFTLTLTNLKKMENMDSVREFVSHYARLMNATNVKVMLEHKKMIDTLLKQSDYKNAFHILIPMLKTVENEEENIRFLLDYYSIHFFLKGGAKI